MERAHFKSMMESTPEEWAAIREIEARNAAQLADRVIGQLEGLREFEQPFAVDRYEHSLQTASRALRDGADEEMTVAALLHDIGDTLAPDNHAQFAAAVLRPYVSDRTHWVVAHHDVFQGYYFWHYLGDDRNAREVHRGNPFFDDCQAFCEKWDQPAFDPDYESEPFATFEPMLRRVFARAPGKP